MKRILPILLLSLSVFACQEDDLTPSGLDELPARERPDMSKPMIAEYKNKYDVSIIYQFDTESDFKFAFREEHKALAWDKVEIKQYDASGVDYGLEMLDSVVLKYFKDDIEFQGETFHPDFKAKNFPKAIFLVDSVGGSYQALGQYLGELNDAESDKSYTCLWNGYEPLFAFNPTLLGGLDDLTRQRNSALYCFLSAIFINRGVYDEFPSEFFEPVADLYEKSVNELAVEEEAEVIKYGPRYYYSAEWYMSKGFALTNESPVSLSGTETKYNAALDTTKVMNFPNKGRDFRNLLHVMICETKRENLEQYFKSPVIISRMQIMIREMYRRGIDVEAINGVAYQYFTEQ